MSERDPGRENIATKFEAAWSVFAATCSHFWAAEASFQAWFAHYLISQFGIDRVAREPIFNTGYFNSIARSGEVRLDLVVTRHPGIMMPHYANRRAKSSDLSGIGLLKELAVISELKVGATVQGGLRNPAILQDLNKLTILLREHEQSNQGTPAPLAYMCVLDNHASKTHVRDLLQKRIDVGDVHPSIELLHFSAPHRPLEPSEGIITR